MTILATLRGRTGGDGYLRSKPAVQRIEAFLHANNGPKTDGYLHLARSWIDVVAGAFPTQFAGLRYFLGTVKELCLVALGDAPAGPQWRINKGGTDYAVYLVDTTDPNASQVRIETGAGIKAARLKT